jgi:AAHS family benzoate transporter-like MFS transporter
MIGTAGMGMLADRIGRKIPLILCLSTFSVFNGALYWAHDFNTFCLLRFFAGIGMGGVLALAITIASEFAPAKMRARMVGIMFIGFAMGPVTVGLCSMTLIPICGWRVVLFIALLPLLLIPFLCVLLP